MVRDDHFALEGFHGHLVDGGDGDGHDGEVASGGRLGRSRRTGVRAQLFYYPGQRAGALVVAEDNVVAMGDGRLGYVLAYVAAADDPDGCHCWLPFLHAYSFLPAQRTRASFP